MTLAIDATALTYTPIIDPISGDQDYVVLRAEDPAVLEEEVNAAGVAQRSDGRNLNAIRMAGAGKGHQFAVSIRFSRQAPDLGGWFPGGGATLRAFFYGGETPEALALSFAEAQQRIQAWAPPGTYNTRTVRAWESAGSSDGARHMGMILLNRDNV
jgi:hypothetical protein